jgi:hypothetical protein
MGSIRRARHIGDDEFLAAMARARRLRPDQFGASRWDVASVLGGMEEQVARHARDPLAPYRRDVPGVDEWAVLNKARKLIRKRVIEGCDCGCPGYFTLAGEQPMTRDWLSSTGA